MNKQQLANKVLPFANDTQSELVCLPTGDEFAIKGLEEFNERVIGMDKNKEVPDRLTEMLKSVAEKNEACFRQCRIMLAGFKALGVQNIEYMDSYMDELWDVMDAGDETEILYRDYLTYISEFNPDEGSRRMEFLEEHLGYWTPVAIAAAFVARDLHKGQKDKGGNDYFTSHLLSVGCNGYDWKEQVVGFLHDAAEDTSHSVDEVVDATRKKLETLGDCKSESWMDEFDIMPYPNGSVLFPKEEEWDEIKDALHALNRHNATNRTEYIEQVKRNRLAINVKLNDLRSNMDISRIPYPSSKDLERLERYREEYAELMECHMELINKQKEDNKGTNRK